MSSGKGRDSDENDMSQGWRGVSDLEHRLEFPVLDENKQSPDFSPFCYGL